MFYLSLLYPSLIIDMFLSLYVCACVGVVWVFSNGYFYVMCVCMSVYFRDFFVCMCGSVV